MNDQMRQAVEMLLEGASNKEVVKAMKIPMNTLLNWKRRAAFKAYYNSRLMVMKAEAISKKHSLLNKAMEAIEACLESENPTIRFKTAAYIIERLESEEIGHTDTRELIRAECTTDTFSSWNPGEQFDRAKYERLCEENGIDPDE